MRPLFSLYQKIMEHRFGAVVRFLVSGGTAAVALLGLLYLFTDIFGVWYLVSSIIAFIGAFIVSFTLHKFWTFNDHNLKRAPFQATSHLFVGLINLGLNTILLYTLVDILQVYYLFAQILISGAIAVGSFFVYKHFIFRKGIAGAAPEKEV